MLRAVEKTPPIPDVFEFIGSSTGEGEAAGAVISLTLPTMSAGDLAVVYLGQDGSLGNNTPDTWTTPSGWTLLAIETTSDSYAGNSAVYYKFMSGTPDTTFDFDSGGSTTRQQVSAICYAFSGASTPTFTVATGISGLPNNPSISTASGNYVIAFATLDDDEPSLSALSGYSEYLQNDLTSGTIFGCIKLVTTTTEDPPAYSGSGNDQWVAITVNIPPL